MPTLKQLLVAMPEAKVTGKADPEIAGLAYDSRAVKKDFVFVCIKGTKQDGHSFIKQAFDRGAVAIVGDNAEILKGLPAGVGRVLVPDSRRALALMACEFEEHPSTDLMLIAVTGTNGKTTTSHLIGSMLREAGKKVGIIGTLGAISERGTIDLGRTTPESVELQSQLTDYLDAGIDAVVMEASSHSLHLSRVEGCLFDAGVFTNLTQDHLDFHTSLDDYFQAKALLFTRYAESSAVEKPFGAVVNVDDHFGRTLAELCPYPVVTYGVESEANVVAEGIEIAPTGATFVVRTATGRTRVNLKLTGRFNVYNALAAFGVGELKGIDPETIRRGLESVVSMPGRLEMIHEGQDFSVAVDYAHTPDGLVNVIATAREFTPGRLIVLFGCGGDRDKSKRPQMGAVASSFADICVITSDNPRSEDPEAILEDIKAGTSEGKAVCITEIDRHKAIENALKLARRGDFVLLAGKGHETYQIFKDRTIQFDDREVARHVLRELLLANAARLA